MSHAANDLPLPEVARLGKPEQTFDLSAGRVAGQQVGLAVFYTICLIFFLVIGLPMLFMGIIRFRPNLPSRDICFGVGGFFLACASVLAYQIYGILVSGRRAAGVFYVFRDFLVAVCPGRPARQIAWERIGAEKGLRHSEQRHAFPVDGEADLVFGVGCADHATLAAAIAEKTTRARWTRLLTPAGVASLDTDRAVPAVLAVDAEDFGLYRISPLAGHVLFVRVGTGSASALRGFQGRRMSTGYTPPLGAGLAGAMAGGMVAHLHASGTARVQNVVDHLEGADEQRLFALALRCPGSSLISAQKLIDLHFTPPTSRERSSRRIPLVAVLRFKDSAWGEKNFFLESRQQLADAAFIFKELLDRDFNDEVASAAASRF